MRSSAKAERSILRAVISSREHSTSGASTLSHSKMSVLQDIQKLAIKKKIPVIRPGYTVKIHQRIKEGEKERVQIFEGLVIKMNSGYGADKTITVRKVFGGIGVEKIFPVHSTNIVKIEVKKKSKVRRAKLYYMRKRSGKSARLKETFVSDKQTRSEAERPKENEASNQKTKPPEDEEPAPPAEEAKTEPAPPAEEAKTEPAPPAEEPPKE